MWLRLTLDNQLASTQAFILRLEYPLLDTISAHLQQADGTFQTLTGGDRLPFSQRLIKERNFAFPLTLASGQQRRAYLRLQSRDTLIAPLVVYTASAYDTHQRTELAVFGMYYGAIFAILLVNTFLFFFLRQRAQVYFVAWLGTYALLELSLSGLGNLFLWREQPELAKLIRPLSLGVLTILALQLTKAYLGLRHLRLFNRNLDPLCWGLGLLAMAGALCLPFTPAIQLAMVNVIILGPILMAVAVQQVSRRNPASYYYLGGLIGMVIGGVLNVLRAFDLVPVNFFTTYGSQLGSLLTLLILNMGLTEQFRRVQRLREQDHVRKLRQTAEMNRKLDEMVKIRTAELEAQTAAAEQARQLAEQALQVKSQFLATMSHEIRTPINGVLGITQILADTPLDPHQRHLVSTIRHSGNALVAIINDILDCSRIEAGKLTLEHIEFPLRDLLDECLALFTSNTAERPVRLMLHVAADVPARILGDPTRLRQIILNLVGNAIKFTSEGHIVVRAAYESGQQQLQLSVTDTGIGISAEQQGKLFQSFSQADSSTTRKYGGTGLGLAICRSLVELMAGTISLQSEPGRGSTFSVRIPAPLAAPEAPVPALQQRRILIADPLPEARAALADMVATWGCEPICVGAADARPAMSVDAAIISHHLEAAERQRWQQLPCPHLLLHPAGQPVDRDHGLAEPVTQQLLRSRLLDLLSVPVQPPPPRSQPTFDQLRTLVVEDNPVNQLVIRGLLKKFGITPVMANDGFEAIHCVQQEAAFDLILMDCEMPNLDGYEATRQLKQLPQCAGTRIVGLSAHALDEHRQMALAAGMDAFLTKPVSGEQLETELAITCARTT